MRNSTREFFGRIIVSLSIVVIVHVLSGAFAESDGYFTETRVMTLYDNVVGEQKYEYLVKENRKLGRDRTLFKTTNFDEMLRFYNMITGCETNCLAPTAPVMSLSVPAPTDTTQWKR